MKRWWSVLALLTLGMLDVRAAYAEPYLAVRMGLIAYLIILFFVGLFVGAIARLLLKAPPIVILDEATAHLDSESERAVQEALAVALEGRTSLVIAHRLSTIRQASEIVVLDKGRVVQRGRHDDLVDAPGLYAALYRAQQVARRWDVATSQRADEELPQAVE